GETWEPERDEQEWLGGRFTGARREHLRAGGDGGALPGRARHLFLFRPLPSSSHEACSRGSQTARDGDDFQSAWSALQSSWGSFSGSWRGEARNSAFDGERAIA